MILSGYILFLYIYISIIIISFVSTSVPPQHISISTDPSSLYEGTQTVVKCKVGRVKPIGNLTIKLQNETSQIHGWIVDQGLNADKMSKFVTWMFKIKFSRCSIFLKSYIIFVKTVAFLFYAFNWQNAPVITHILL